MQFVICSKHMGNENVIQKLADNIITQAGGDKLPDEAKEVFRQNLEAQIMRRLGLIIMEHLDGEGIDAYEKLTRDNPVPPATELQSFLEQYLPDYEEKIKVGMDEFMKEISGFLTENKTK
jgi:hypothetical protein